MNDRRNFLTVCLSGAAWIMGWNGEKAKEPIGGLGDTRDVMSITYLGGDGTIRRTVRSSFDPHIWWVFTECESGSKPCES